MKLRTACSLAIVLSTAWSPAAIVWEFGAPGITTAFGSGTGNSANPAEWDIITPSVTITRNTIEGIFNITAEPSYFAFTSPAGTRWAFAGLGPDANQNPTGAAFRASNFASLTFEPWADALGRNGTLPDRTTGNLASNIVGTPGVVHIIAEDIYLDIEFTSWGGSFGFWGYRRADGPIPEPSAAVLVGLASLGLFRRRR